MKCKLSVIVPIYNSENTLKRCIDSIIEQSFKDFEIILVNDGSVDSSLDICQYYINNNSNIRLIDKKNEGVAKARSDGLSIANGEFISFVDSDDFLKNDMYEKMLKHDEDIVMCGRTVIKKDKKIIKLFSKESSKKYCVEESICKILECREMDSSLCDKVFRKSLFDELEFGEFRINEELYILIDLILKSNGVFHIGESLYNVDQSQDSATRTNLFSDKFLDSLEISHFLFLKLKSEKYLKSLKSFHSTILINLYNRLTTSLNRHDFLDLEQKLEKELKEVTMSTLLNSRTSIKIKLMYLIFRGNKKLYIKLFSIVRG